MPMLEQHEVAAYLLERRLVGRRSIVSGQLRIADASSRNRNFRVSGEAGESYLLKQGIAADSAESLANEAALYRRLAVGASPVAARIPRFYGHDAQNGVLILEWIAGGRDLHRHDAARDGCSRTLAAALGRALAALHGVAPDDEALRDDAPWVLSLHRPRLDALRYLSAASIELIGVIQDDERFARGLDELRDGWRVEALVHRDVKWANCIAHAPRGGARRTRITLVDWEMAGWGDPALDVGSAFGEFLGHAPAPIALASLVAPEHPGEPPPPRSHDLRPAVAAFLRGYVRARGLDERAASRLLVRAVRYGAARIVQSAYEDTQETARMTAGIADSLQVGRAMLLAPCDAAVELLGIAP
jgi:aminoglycoside phosphotransferase (APT) family kinase protein